METLGALGFKTYVAALVAALVAKATDDRVDSFALRAAAGPNGYSLQAVQLIPSRDLGGGATTTSMSAVAKFSDTSLRFKTYASRAMGPSTSSGAARASGSSQLSIPHLVVARQRTYS